MNDHPYRRNVRLPIALSSLHVAAPCSARWEDMIGDGRVRFCASCAKNVYNVEALTAAEALAVVQEHEGMACLRIKRRADGTLITGDCAPGRKRRRRRRLAGVLAGGAALAASALSARPPEPTLSADAPPLAPQHRMHVAGTMLGQTTVHLDDQEQEQVQKRAKPRHPRPRPGTTIGCACVPGDPLCSCL